MRLSTLTLIALHMLYQSINAAGDWESLQKVLAQQDEKKALSFVSYDSTLTELVKKHFVVMKALDKCSNKLWAMSLDIDLDIIHSQMKSHLSK